MFLWAHHTCLMRKWTERGNRWSGPKSGLQLEDDSLLVVGSSGVK